MLKWGNFGNIVTKPGRVFFYGGYPVDTVIKHNIIAPLLALMVPIADLSLDPANARTGHDIQRIAESLRVYGQRKPIVVNENEGNKVEAGNGTLTAARSLGWTHIAAVYVQDDPTTAAGYAIADNRLGDLSMWDADVLPMLTESLGDDIFTGFAEGEIDSLLARALGEADDTLAAALAAAEETPAPTPPERPTAAAAPPPATKPPAPPETPTAGERPRGPLLWEQIERNPPFFKVNGRVVYWFLPPPESDELSPDKLGALD